MAQDATLLLSEPATAQRQRLRATYASLGVAGVLIAAKLVVWISTGSVATANTASATARPSRWLPSGNRPSWSAAPCC